MNKYIITIKGRDGANYLFPIKGDEAMVKVWQNAGFTVSRELGKIPLWFFVDGKVISLRRKLRFLERTHQFWRAVA